MEGRHKQELSGVMGAVLRVLGGAGFCLLFAVSVALPARAQAGGSIQGTVTDKSGAAVPQAHVSITNLTTNAKRLVITDRKGFYSVPDLPPADYQMAASAPGFAQVEAKITLTIGAARV